jgi:hypothetical protein
MNTNLKGIQVVMAVVIGFCVAVWTFRYLQPKETAEEMIVQTSNNLNARLPMNMDRETRWDSTEPGPGKCLTYCYTLVNKSKSELDPEKLTATMKPRLLLNYRTNPEMKLIRDNRVILRYKYKDKVGETVAVIEVSPDEF